MKKCLQVLIIASLLVAMTAAAASAADAVRIGSGIDPAISQNLVAYTRAAGDEVHVYNLATGQDLKIKAKQASGADIDTGSGLVVWCQNGKTPQLVIYDLKAARIRGSIPSVEAGTKASISGNRIAWSSSGKVNVYDLASGTQSSIGAGYSPDMSGSKIAYEAVDSAGEHDIVVYDLTSHTSVTVPHDGDLTNPRLSGEVVAFLDENDFIAQYDLTTGAYQLVNVNTVYGHSDEGEIHGLALDDGVLVYDKVHDNVMGDAGIYSLDGGRLNYLNDTRTSNQDGPEVGATVDVSSYGSGHYAVWGFIPDLTAKPSNGGIYVCECSRAKTGWLSVFSNQAGAQIDIFHDGQLYAHGDGDWSDTLPVGHYMVLISQRGGEALVDTQAVDLTEEGYSIDYRNG